jgi:hypothetical protein
MVTPIAARSSVAAMSTWDMRFSIRGTIVGNHYLDDRLEPILAAFGRSVGD